MPKINKQEIWREKEKEVDDISNLNPAFPIDPGIKTLVIALRAFGLPTNSSCIGHADDKNWITYPAISFLISPPEELYSVESADKHKQHRESYLVAEEKLIELLDEFYIGRKVPFETRLHPAVYKNNKWGVFYLESYGAEAAISQSSSIEEKMEKLEKYQKEMIDFGNFLKSKFLKD